MAEAAEHVSTVPEPLRKIYGEGKEKKEEARSEIWDLTDIEKVIASGPTAVVRAPALSVWLLRVLGQISWMPEPRADLGISNADWKKCVLKANELLQQVKRTKLRPVLPARVKDRLMDRGRRVVAVYPGSGGEPSEVDFTHEVEQQGILNAVERENNHAEYEAELRLPYAEAKGMMWVLQMYGPGIPIINAESPRPKPKLEPTIPGTGPVPRASTKAAAEGDGVEGDPSDRIDPA